MRWPNHQASETGEIFDREKIPSEMLPSTTPLPLETSPPESCHSLILGWRSTIRIHGLLLRCSAVGSAGGGWSMLVGNLPPVERGSRDQPTEVRLKGFVSYRCSGSVSMLEAYSRKGARRT